MANESINNNEQFKISAKVVDRMNGLRQYSNIRLIRIVSKDHNLLIMEDFMPVIGEIDGKVEIVVNDEIIPYDNIKGFYMHKKNQFYLLIEEYKKTGMTIDSVLTEGKEEKDA